MMLSGLHILMLSNMLFFMYLESGWIEVSKLLH